MRSAVKTRHNDVGEQSECLNDNPDVASFAFSSTKPLTISRQEQLCASTKVPLLVSGEKISDGSTTTEDNEKQSEEQQESDNDPTELLLTQDGQLPLNLMPPMTQNHTKRSSNAFDNDQ